MELLYGHCLIIMYKVIMEKSIQEKLGLKKKVVLTYGYWKATSKLDGGN